MQRVLCDYCCRSAAFVTGDRLYPHRPDLYNLNFWACKDCDAHVGCHKGTDKPMGRLADKPLRDAKRLAHRWLTLFGRTAHAAGATLIAGLPTSWV